MGMKRKAEMAGARVILLLVAITVGAYGQDSAATAPEHHQVPDESGVFYVGPEVSAPRLIRTVTALYPNVEDSRRIQGMTVLAMVIDAKGLPSHIQILHSHGSGFDQSAIAAVQHSVFEPAVMNNKPVPAWIDVRVVFRANRSEAVPQVVIAERDLAPPDASQLEDKHHRPVSYTPPFPIHTVDADFADPFVQHPWVQVAIVEVLVSEDGSPKEVRVRRGLGFGLDEKAAAAVWHYRFLPATNKGKPIAARRDILVSFEKF